MPPKGYKSVTISEELLEKIKDVTGVRSGAEAIRRLLLLYEATFNSYCSLMEMLDELQGEAEKKVETVRKAVKPVTSITFWSKKGRGREPETIEEALRLEREEQRERMRELRKYFGW